MTIPTRRAYWALGAVLLASCALQPAVFAPGEPCAAGNFTVIDDFSAARRGDCTVLSDDRVRLDIRPEDGGYVNDSPWYAFRIVPSAPGNAHLSLRYRNGHHRYAPKISHDGRTWARLDESLVTVASDRRSVKLTVPLRTSVVYVAAQELVTPATYDAWSRGLAAASGIPLRKLGRSRNGLPMHVLDSNSTAADVVLLIGRQHPPEVTGAFAFFAFAETVFGDSELARAFRDRFRVLAIPLMNPDGVASGHWRHNLGHVDINRDWGPFTQPETRLVRDLLDDLDANGQALRMFIDFHSTQENVFYTQQEPTQPPGFTRTWLDNAARRIADYPFRNGESPAKNETVAKNYVYRRYGIPAVTYEVADDVDRDADRVAARIFAEELMKSMLAQAY